MLSVIILSVIMLSVITLSVIMLSIIALQKAGNTKAYRDLVQITAVKCFIVQA